MCNKDAVENRTEAQNQEAKVSSQSLSNVMKERGRGSKIEAEKGLLVLPQAFVALKMRRNG